MRTSQPKPAATGKHLERAAAETARWPDSGSRTSIPPSAPISLRPTRLAMPKPPPIRSAKTATFRSASPSSKRTAGSPREIGVGEQQPARRGGTLRQRERLALAARAAGAGRSHLPPRRRRPCGRASRRRRRSPRRRESPAAARPRSSRSRPPRRGRRRGSSAVHPPVVGAGGTAGSQVAAGGAPKSPATVPSLRRIASASLPAALVDVVHGREMLRRESVSIDEPSPAVRSTPTAGTPTSRSPE